MLTVLGGLAEFERELILARTSDGRARARLVVCVVGGRLVCLLTNAKKRSSDSLRAKRRAMWRAHTFASKLEAHTRAVIRWH